MSKQTHLDKLNVNHNFNYHCEIQYETEKAFNYISAVGDTMQELLTDIDSRLKQYKNRDPKVVKAIYLPNKENINITPKIISLLALRPVMRLK